MFLHQMWISVRHRFYFLAKVASRQCSSVGACKTVELVVLGSNPAFDSFIFFLFFSQSFKEVFFKKFEDFLHIIFQP